MGKCPVKISSEMSSFFLGGGIGGAVSWGNVWGVLGNCSVGVSLSSNRITTLYIVVVMICVTLVNTQTHTHTHTDRTL